MKLICVDDEKLVLARTVALCEKLPGVTDVKGFSNCAEALAWLSENSCALALLDIDMPDMDGLMLAARVKELRPDAAIVFVTGYPQSVSDAVGERGEGYVWKPVTAERLREEFDRALAAPPARETPHIAVRTFGGFEAAVDGVPVRFEREEVRELLALLVHRQGKELTRREACAVLLGDRSFRLASRKRLDAAARSLRDTLERSGASAMLVPRRDAFRVVPAAFDCDLYRFLGGETAAVNAYRGDYLSAYPWASLAEACRERLGGRR